MPNMNRVRVTWTGLTGLPGISTFYLLDTATDVSAITTFFTANKNLFPSGLSWTIPSSGDKLRDSDGALVGGWTGTGGATVTSTAGALAYSAGVGARVRWQTNQIVGRRRLAGSTFLTSLNTTSYTTNGQLLPASVTGIQNAATALLTAAPLLVWHRGPKGGTSGVSWPIVSAVVPTQVSWLRSRRT